MILRPPISTLFPYTTLFRSFLTRAIIKSPMARLWVFEIDHEWLNTLEMASMIRGCRFMKIKIGRAHRLNSSHQIISYAVFCLKKKKNTKTKPNTCTTDQDEK